MPTAKARDESELLVSGIDVKPTTTAGFGQNGEPLVSFELQGEGARKFAQTTTEVAGKNRFIPIFSRRYGDFSARRAERHYGR